MGSAGFNYATSIGEDAWNNAESVAFMGLLSKLAQLGFEVDADGNLERIAASVASKGKRSLANRFHFDKEKWPSSTLPLSLQDDGRSLNIGIVSQLGHI